MRKLLFLVVASALLIPITTFAGLKFEERVFDFGHVGIGFNVFHDFKLVNEGNETHRVDSFSVSCDCTKAMMSDSVASPGETIEFEIKFDTKNFYGPTNKSLKIFTDFQALGQHIFYYQAFVGQWIKGLRPSNEALFFLPGHGPKILLIKNELFEHVKISSLLPYDSSFTINVISKNAKKGSAIEIEIAPNANLTKGTHESCLTIELSIKENLKPVRMTIPVKSVNY